VGPVRCDGGHRRDQICVIRSRLSSERLFGADHPLAVPWVVQDVEGHLDRGAAIPKEVIEYVRQFLGERYVAEEEIGRGGAARVYRARDMAGRLVALKVLRPELLASLTAKRFLREISVLQQLDHPRIARILDFGEAEWLVYFVMEYVSGLTLRKAIDTVRPLPLAEVRRGACEILDAVAHAHGRGIVHRDVKPDNIVLAEGRGAVLLDFGIARAIADSEEHRVTRSGFTVGSSAYMSPEQAAGHPVDHRTDIYALGCLLFECLAGEPPFVHPMEVQVLQMHQSASPPDVRKQRPEVPKELGRVVAKALEKDPKRRWQSAAEMRAAIEGCPA
jgi:serine/threonine-protein kinase